METRSRTDELERGHSKTNTNFAKLQVSLIEFPSIAIADPFKCEIKLHPLFNNCTECNYPLGGIETW